VLEDRRRRNPPLVSLLAGPYKRGTRQRLEDSCFSSSASHLVLAPGPRLSLLAPRSSLFFLPPSETPWHAHALLLLLPLPLPKPLVTKTRLTTVRTRISQTSRSSSASSPGPTSTNLLRRNRPRHPRRFRYPRRLPRGLRNQRPLPPTGHPPPTQLLPSLRRSWLR
jgi:hypothetical protein